MNTNKIVGQRVKGVVTLISRGCLGDITELSRGMIIGGSRRSSGSQVSWRCLEGGESMLSRGDDVGQGGQADMRIVPLGSGGPILDLDWLHN